MMAYELRKAKLLTQVSKQASVLSLIEVLVPLQMLHYTRLRETLTVKIYINRSSL